MTLAERAAVLLATGPASTKTVAREVMGLVGNAVAVSAAVRTLLGPDPRFEQDGGGEWHLVDPPATFQPPLRRLDYAVVDVETTGGMRWRGHGIVEIAVVHVSGGSISAIWQTLLDPGRRVPPFVTELTGISPAMVRGAPTFEDVAGEIFRRLDGRVFVAHNVGFDWSFVASHLRRTLGQVPDVHRLCTVQLARRMVRSRRRSLDALAAHFGIEIHARHRALGDALATARILLRLLDVAELRGLADLRALERAVDGGAGGDGRS